MENNWVKIYTSADFHQSEMIRQLLAENDIDAVILNKQDSSYHFGVVDVYIHPSDFNTATELIIQKDV